ncbi:MAG: hypothetical protein COZ31_08315 [Nitrospirae bacterium CG_4_10_14_3_um_filter_44_29]|nr:hypothetical protein [Nitrospirota bacterium]OIO30542.1 MAG: hypothetical protein AUJ60_02660 [Nitrospirae bacterium CG1_02_44_142]PIP70227.1 MAG: hypothetical protein COW90_06440 [Nitrospirae bacterium CG22_combo_CG10-13_8_21_14_all_44_11]PIV43706.1 MAG: hypothetical protein COS28_01740 [Nitrospirae bacterium CG02_land_8_20_14_3_00_44_33]PIV66736.1 MAG: hypothetical protein COS10_04735 [Nitrospirae bacterium CG01_land_8_20_14_3_00_44_22]PIW89316.1 MAG: hypothetical protein COZ93_05690 [Nit
MGTKWILIMLIIFIIGTLAGFRASHVTGIQPGYFEKQEAPAYGASEEKAIGAELGKEYEEHFRDMYKEE